MDQVAVIKYVTKMTLLIISFLLIFLSFTIGTMDGSRRAHMLEDCSSPNNRFEKYFLPYPLGRQLGCFLFKPLEEN